MLWPNNVTCTNGSEGKPGWRASLEGALHVRGYLQSFQVNAWAVAIFK